MVKLFELEKYSPPDIEIGDEEVNIQAQTMKEAQRALVALLKRGVPCLTLSLDTILDKNHFLNIRGNRLEQFIKTGNISNMTLESNIQEQYNNDFDCGWLNIKTKQYIKNPPLSYGDLTKSHSASVIDDPEKYGIDKWVLARMLDSDKRIDNNRPIIKMMNNLGWVRLTLTNTEINLESQNLKEIHRALLILIKQGIFR